LLYDFVCVCVLILLPCKPPIYAMPLPDMRDIALADNDTFSSVNSDAETASDAEQFASKSSRWLAVIGAGLSVLAITALAVVAAKGGFSLRDHAKSPTTTDRPETPSPQTRAATPELTAAVATSASLYCFTVMLPFGNEPKLIQKQYDQTWSLFDCDAYAVLSNESLELSPGHPKGQMTTVFNGSMAVEFNTWTWAALGGKMALNTPVFVRAWKSVFQLGHWRNFDWTVKVDPDTVFFSRRLAELLDARPLLPPEDTAPSNASLCENCTLTGQTMSTCASHVAYVQHDGASCPEALADVARGPPTDCGCDCGKSACSNPTSVYLRNCAVNLYTPTDPAPGHAMHGPLEVLSHDAMADLEKGLEDCAEKFKDSFDQWGEDWFLEHCLLDLGVLPLDNFESLKDGDCATVAWPCDQAHAAFQPFKELDVYEKCQHNANTKGQWPPKAFTQRYEYKFYDTYHARWTTSIYS